MQDFWLGWPEKTSECRRHMNLRPEDLEATTQKKIWWFYRSQNIPGFTLVPGNTMMNKKRQCSQGTHSEYVSLIYLGVNSFGIPHGHKALLVQWAHIKNYKIINWHQLKLGIYYYPFSYILLINMIYYLMFCISRMLQVRRTGNFLIFSVKVYGSPLPLNLSAILFLIYLIPPSLLTILSPDK